MKSNILEIRALGFIYICWFIYTNKYTDNIIPFSIIVSLQRFINIISNDNNIISNDNNNNNDNNETKLLQTKIEFNDDGSFAAVSIAGDKKCHSGLFF